VKLKIPAGTFDAYLFDCDGTIADSMPSHYIAWKSAFAGWNCNFPEDLFYAWGGFPVAEIISRLNEKRRLKMPVAEVARKKRNSICCSATAKGGARSAGAYRCTAWPDSVCGGLGKYA
jgi:beta-phosphoglucomutase-like phosphatase (HAD superfamily)